MEGTERHEAVDKMRFPLAGAFLLAPLFFLFLILFDYVRDEFEYI